MNKRFDLVVYSIVMFFSFLLVIFFPDFFLANRQDKAEVVQICKFLIIFPTLFLFYKIYQYIKEDE